MLILHVDEGTELRFSRGTDRVALRDEDLPWRMGETLVVWCRGLPIGMVTGLPFEGDRYPGKRVGIEAPGWTVLRSNAGRGRRAC